MSFLDIFTNSYYVLKIRLVIYGILAFFSFFIFIGAIEMKDSYKVGNQVFTCPLYVDLSSSAPPEANCNFPVVIAIVFQLVYLVCRLVSLALLLTARLREESGLFSNVMELAYVMIDFLGFMFTLASAAILSAGTNETCDNVNKLNNSNCEDHDWYTASEVAQAGAWISVLLWLPVFVIGFIYLCRSGKMPVIHGNRSSSSGGASRGGGQTAPPTMEMPPYTPDDPPRY